MTTNHRISNHALAALPVAAAEREAAYQAALKLVTRIEKNLKRNRVLYWRISDKAPLKTLNEVVNAILADDLLLPECEETEVVLGMAAWVAA